MKIKSSLAILFGLAMSFDSSLFAQPKKANHDESLVKMGELPPLLKKADGHSVAPVEWAEHREGLVKTLAENQFGFSPQESCSLSFEKVESGLMNEGETLREQYVVTLKTDYTELAIDLAV